jgi:hypothetical protein
MGKMAIGARKQKSINLSSVENETYCDLGKQIWNESMKSLEINKLMNEKFAN